MAPYDQGMVPRALRGAPLLAIVALCLAASGCAGQGDAPPQTSTPSPSAATGMGTMDCQDTSLLSAPGEALAVFPDNDVDWTARPSELSLAELVLVSLTPARDEVGYPEFQFVYRCDADGPSRIATYALEGEQWVLLATSDQLVGEELPAALP